MPTSRRASDWKYVRGLTPPVLVLAVLVCWLAYALHAKVEWSQDADEYNLREWLSEARVFRKTLPDLVREYLATRNPDKAEEIYQQMDALGNPTRMYQEQLPLFPNIYRMEVRFADRLSPPEPPIVWDYGTGSGQGRLMKYRLLGEHDDRAELYVEYQLHAYNKRQHDEEQRQTFLLIVSGLAAAVAVLAGFWVYSFLKRERERELQRIRAEQQIEHAEKLLLENELSRQEAEHRQRETERTLLEQRLATQNAESQALELKSQLYASISIMAGSYAHNIKNLLVRPNDLLSRCLEADGLSNDQSHMLSEVRETLGTVTERLQQILRTVRRDPNRSELSRLDLNAVVADIHRTWEDLGREKWKLTLSLTTHAEPLWIEGDLSHLQQAIENLVFNARDATFEMRNQLREQARRAEGLDSTGRRQALIEAAAWKGSVTLRTRRQGDRAVLEVQDNGIGMTEEVRRRCIETHFTTKRDNAVYEGNTTGMGLGLSFVVVILEHHHAKLEIESEPLRGALFRTNFPLKQSDGVADKTAAIVAR
ncbi:MAG: HAMP domain-containing histidine kinase [Gemmataceae bacterium]|nr:HAMP domain-containing histidine kinase [Gemmataceae bacterium]